MSEAEALTLAEYRRVQAQLPPDQADTIQRQAQELRSWLRELYPSGPIGPYTCLEILAAIGQALNERGGPAQ